MNPSVLPTPTSIDVPRGGRETLRTENLTRRFGHRAAVDHVSFSVAEGEFLC